jgi:hypothetical protein
MPVHNAEIAEIFTRYAALLEIKGANALRVQAYHGQQRQKHRQGNAPGGIGCVSRIAALCWGIVQRW